jgi:hypothetical protein
LRTNRHHLWWPRKDYQSPLERKFRGLSCHIVVMDVRAHQLLHILTAPPEKPSREDMKAAIERHKQKGCGCYATS